jgi:acyl transferase domain-containing protein
MEPIAIIGIGCRFPKANNPELFWQLLHDGVNAITQVPKERWDIDSFYDSNPNTPGKMNTRFGGFLENVDKFDAEFFGISHDEAEHSDPQQRLFLEVAWEALENAGIVPESLGGSQTGVFVGMCTLDYHRLLYKNFAVIGTHSGTGTTPCIAANRLSYLLDLHGPSMAVDTACSSSLVGVHLACQSLRSEESDLCLAGGVNLILSPDSTISSSQTRLLSAKGSCNTFDASADGYVRGEGCGVIVLKRLNDAIRDGDNVLALIRGSAVNQDGLSNSLTAPNGLAQQAVIRQALKNAKVQPSEISYVDAHAVGTPIGDAVEFKALKAVLAEGRKPEQRCWISSVKPNIGHLEAAAGISALIKVVLSLQHQKIPPLLNLKQFNPYISLENTPFSIPTEPQKWSRGENNRLASVSAFGFGGTNAHIILEEAPIPNQKKNYLEIERPLHLITLSAKSDSALLEMAKSYENFLASHPNTSLADISFTANTGRTHFDHRICIVTKSIAQLQEQLGAFIQEKETIGLLKGKGKSRKRPKIAFFFPGQGLEYKEMGYQLYETQPNFRKAIDLCASILSPDFELKINNSEFCEITKFAIEYALVQLWLSWGIKPNIVMGEGVGEYVAATVAGVFNLKDALKLLLEQTRRIQMGAIRNTMEAFVQVAEEVTFSVPRIPIISSFSGQLATTEIATPEYWCCHLQKSGKFTEKVETMLGYEILLTIGEKPNSLPKDGKLCLFSFSQGLEDWEELLHSLGELWLRGIMVNWSSFDQDYNRRLVQLPTYPFQRQRYWFQTPEIYSEAS